MAAYTRSAVLATKVVNLRALFLDSAGMPVTLDALPNVYIYNPSVSTEDREADLASDTYTNASEGPLTPTLLSAGYYELNYTVPSGAEAGLWYDVWEADIDGVAINSNLNFTVIDAPKVSDQALGRDTMVMIELDDTITDSTGEIQFEGTTLHYTTEYSSFYASVDLVRLEAGPWVSYVPDATVALMIHWASKEVDHTVCAPVVNSDYYRYARTRFCVFDCAKRLLSLQGHGVTATTANSSDGKKRLGDLSITGGSASSSLGDMIDPEIVNWINEQREEWWRVVNAGGSIVQGQGFSPGYAVKGQRDPDRRMTGRLWEDPASVHYAQPTVNQKGMSGYAVDSNGRVVTRRRGRFGFNRGQRRWNK